jgi:hypothetical protein
MKRIVVALLMILGAQVCQAATIHVPTDSATIQAGINGAMEGDTVIVEDGTYTGDGNRDMSLDGKNIVVMSENGPTVTIIDCQGSAVEPHRGFNFINGEDSAAILDGFTVKNGYGPFSHSHNEGGAVLCEASSPTFKNCIFTDNDGVFQGGAFSCFESTPTFLNCTFEGNNATWGVIYLNDSYATIHNTILAFNTLGSPAGPVCGYCDLFCCNIYGNAGGNWVGFVADQFGQNGNLSVNPLFCNMANSDYHLDVISFCNSYINPACGLIGALDNGCGDPENLPFAGLITYDPYVYDSLVTTSNFEIYWSYFNMTPTDQYAFEIEIGTDDDWDVAETWNSGQVVISDTSTAYSGPPLANETKYYLRMRVSNGTNWGMWTFSNFRTHFPIVIHVPADKPTIQSGIDSSTYGDTVLIADGIYIGDGNRDISYDGKNIVVISENGPEVTIIDCEGSISDQHRGFEFFNGEDSTAILQGFTIRNGYGPYTMVHDHTEAGGVLCANASPTIRECVFENCFGGWQGGNIACFNSYCRISSCTFVGGGAQYGGCLYSRESDPILENCIIAFGSEGVAIDGDASLSCCDIYGNLGGDWVGNIAGQFGQNGNLSSDPIFCDYDNSNFHLQLISPCGSIINDECGLIGALEAGCSESDQLPIAYPISLDPNMDDSLIISSSPEIFWSYYDTTGTVQYGYELEVGTDNDWSDAEMWNSGQIISSDTSAVYSGLTLYDDTRFYLRIRVSDGTHWGAWLYTRFYTFLDDIIYISEDYLTIQAGINYASEGDTVFVRDGTYKGDGNRDLNFGGKNMVLRSENGPENTTITGEYIINHRGFLFHSGEDTTAVIDGFTISSFFPPIGQGGSGILCVGSNPIIKNCILIDNATVDGYGAGIEAVESNITHINCMFSKNFGNIGHSAFYTYGTYEFINCIFSENEWGALFIKFASATFTNCTFSDNISAYDGAGMWLLRSDALLSNCVFINNSTRDPLLNQCGGGLYSQESTTIISNCTFVGNQADSAGSAIFADEGNVTIENTIIAFGTKVNPVSGHPAYFNNISCTNIFGNSPGDWVGDIGSFAGINGNISLDPLFCDMDNGNFEIDSLSPCTPYSPENTCGVLIGAKDVGCGFIVCGDANGDEIVNVSDAVAIINYVFVSGDPPDPLCEGDANGDGSMGVSDAVYIINYIFVGGDPPATDCCDE